MTVRSRVLLCLITAVVAGALAACGGSSSLTGSSDTPVPGASSAVIAGTVVSASTGGSMAGDVSASSSSGGIRVSVSGTSIETTTDDSGHFTLAGVTTGEPVELRFEAPGIDARLEVGGLVAGQTLTLSVSLSGSTVSLLSPGGEVELRGRVESVASDGLVVSGQRVVVGAATAVLGRDNETIALSDVAVGSFVEVEGWPQPDGGVLATKVQLEDGQDGEGEVEFRGLVESAASGVLVVAGRTVVVDATTQLLGRENQTIMFSDIAIGSFVEVEGWSRSDGTVLAKKVKLEDEGGEGEGQEVELQGTIQDLSPLMVSGTVVATNAGTVILDDDNHEITYSGLQVGMRVEVEGWRQADASVLARKIKIED